MRFFLAGAFLLFSITSFGQARRALNLIEKQKYESAYDLLSNGLAKDTTSASIPFVLAKLYLVKSWPQHQLDSAYSFSIRSLFNYDLLDEKHLDKHIKEGFGKTRLLSLKKRIDSLAFGVAKTGGSQHDYQFFIDTHTDANQLDSAFFYRNQQAYLKASSINSLQSYKQFLEDFPNAKDWQEADAKYQLILYYESTKSGKLTSYKSFVNLYPQSPYLERAISHIYSIKVVENTTRAMLDFINEYPNSQSAQKAIGLLYHKHLEQEPANSFADKYPKINISDSLNSIIKNQEKTLIPIWNEPLFQLIDLTQKVVIDSLIGIDVKTIDQDFYLVRTQHNDKLISKNGMPFYTTNSLVFERAERGFIFVNTKSGKKIVHKNGQIIDAGEEAVLLGPLVGYKSNGLWGIKSITNIELLTPSYDSIWMENQLVFLSSNDKISIAKVSDFYPALDQGTNQKMQIFDDYEWFSDELLWVERGGKEGLFSEKMEEYVPLGKHQIDLAGKGWSITEKKDVLVPDFLEIGLTNFSENEHWQIGSVQDSLIVKYKYNQLFNPTSASLLGPSAIIMHWADSGFVYLTDTLKFYRPANCEIKPLYNSNNGVDYYEVTEGEDKIIRNNEGLKLDLPTFLKITPLNQTYFQLELGNDLQLYHSNGNIILEGYDGYALMNDSTISLLKDEQFGIIQPKDSIYIAPAYNQKLQPLVDSLWVASSTGKVGLINAKSDTLLPFTFDVINYWTNGLLMAKTDYKWHIYDLKTAQFVESGIVSYTSITRGSSPKITYQKGVGLGVFDSEKGVVLKPTYTDISLMGSQAQPYYRAEKYVEEAGLHIMLYYNMNGKLLFQNILNEKAFSGLYGKSDE